MGKPGLVIMLLIVVVVFLFVAPSAAEKVKYEKIGCYKDKNIHDKRALPVLLKNLRLTIDWRNEWPSFERVINECGVLAKNKGYSHFAIQFFGECWSGPQAYSTFSRYGESEDCVHGVGTRWTNQVYMLVGPGREECGAGSYHTLSEADRSVSYKGSAGLCDNPLPSGQGWYRFTGQAGNVMAMSPPEPSQCNAHRPGWMDGELPTNTHAAVERKVCFHYNSSPCKRYKTVLVRNCGHFYVYNLKVTPSCSLRYCGDRIPLPEV